MSFEILESDFEVGFAFSGWVGPAMKKKRAAFSPFSGFVLLVFDR
jgi:hypothetical protein